MARIVQDRHILFDLSRHIPAEIHVPQSLALGAQMQYHRTRKLVMCRPYAVNGLKNMYRVPSTFTLAFWRC